MSMPRNAVQIFGPHKISLSSIESPTVDALIGDDKIDILYTDPPWGDGSMKYWTNLNAKQNNGFVVDPLSYQALIDRIKGFVIGNVDGWLVIETGVKWGDQLMESFPSLHNKRLMKTIYRSGAKMAESVTFVASTKAGYETAHVAPQATHGQKFCTDIIRQLSGEISPKAEIIVFDPCCGMGYTAQACLDIGLSFRGNEFNEARLTKTTTRLEKWLKKQ